MLFFEKAGTMALGSRLRHLSEAVTKDSAKVYKAHGMDFEPRWFPVFYIISEEGPGTVTEIAEKIGHSHVSVSQIVRQMKKAELLTSTRDRSDGRRSLIALTKKGERLIPTMKVMCGDVHQAVEALLSGSSNNLWEALNELENALEENDLLSRVQLIRKEREAQHVAIIDYAPEHAPHFKSLNEEWIRHYFTLEDTDRKMLDHPQENIIDKGGHILIAKYKGRVVGTCALIKMDERTFELAKMGVSPEARGKSIGWLLGKAVIEKARAVGAKRLYLESNTRLEPAINLYYKLGFNRIYGHPSPYARCNIQMEMFL